MSRSKTELSVTDRLIIQLVKFRTSSPKHPTFFGDNKYITKCIDIKPDTARKAVAKLVKLGYLGQEFDKQDRRHLFYTGKEFVPIVENMNNIDKKVLRDDKNYFEREAQNATHELELAQIRIETLERENTRLQSKLFQAELRITQLENLFTTQGVTKERIDMMIERMMDMQVA